MIKAGTREKQFIDLCNLLDTKMLSGKMSFENPDKVYVSVDNSIILDNDIILIEIDASNQAKLVSGQYTLLNLLKNSPSKKYAEIVKEKNLIFFVIHCYGNSDKKNNYNPQRSRKNFDFINKFAFNGKGLQYGSMHIDNLTNVKINTAEKLLTEIKRNICQGF